MFLKKRFSNDGVGEACGVGDALAGGFCAVAPDVPMRRAVKRSRARTA
jgi:hypothetical protein